MRQEFILYCFVFRLREKEGPMQEEAYRFSDCATSLGYKVYLSFVRYTEGAAHYSKEEEGSSDMLLLVEIPKEGHETGYTFLQEMKRIKSPYSFVEEVSPRRLAWAVPLN